MTRTVNPADIRPPTTEQQAEKLKASLADLLKAAQERNAKTKKQENK